MSEAFDNKSCRSHAGNGQNQNRIGLWASGTEAQELWDGVLIGLMASFALWLWLSLRGFQTFSLENSKHLSAVLGFMDSLSRGGFVAAWRSAAGVYPPLTACLAGAVCWLRGYFSESLAILSQAPFLMVLSVSAVKIGRPLLGRCGSAALSAAAAAAAAVCVMNSGFMLDVPLTAAVCACWAYMTRENVVQSLSRAAVLGFLAGAAMLVKWTALPFVLSACLGRLLVYFFQERKRMAAEAVRAEEQTGSRSFIKIETADETAESAIKRKEAACCRKQDVKLAKCLCAGLAVFAAVCSLWYVSGFGAVLSTFEAVESESAFAPAGAIRIGAADLFVLALGSVPLLWTVCLGCALSLVRGFIYKEKLWFFWLFVFTVSSAFVISLHTHDPRFVMPLLPIMMLWMFSFFAWGRGVLTDSGVKFSKSRAAAVSALRISVSGVLIIAACLGMFSWTLNFAVPFKLLSAAPVYEYEWGDPLGIASPAKRQTMDSAFVLLKELVEKGYSADFEEAGSDFAESAGISNASELPRRWYEQLRRMCCVFNPELRRVAENSGKVLILSQSFNLEMSGDYRQQIDELKNNAEGLEGSIGADPAGHDVLFNGEGFFPPVEPLSRFEEKGAEVKNPPPGSSVVSGRVLPFTETRHFEALNLYDDDSMRCEEYVLRY